MIELNNMASELQAAEEAEELVVLTMLTQRLVENSNVLYTALNAITWIDLATARARHAECDNCLKSWGHVYNFCVMLCDNRSGRTPAQPHPMGFDCSLSSLHELRVQPLFKTVLLKFWLCAVCLTRNPVRAHSQDGVTRVCMVSGGYVGCAQCCSQGSATPAV